MKNRKPNLREYGKIIQKIPNNLSVKSELQSVHSCLTKTLRDSKRQHANQDFYKPRIDQLFKVLRRVL